MAALRIRNFADWWNRFWFSTFDTHSLGLFRIALGLLITIYYVAIFPNWTRFYGADGVLSLSTADPVFSRQDWLSAFYWTEGWIPEKTYWWLGIGAAGAFLFGWKTRLATSVLFLLHVSTVHRNGWAVNGEDMVFRMLLFYGCFAPLGASLSLDSLLKRKSAQTGGERNPPLVWPVRLMQCNICLIYIISLPNKLIDDVAWWDGTAIYLSMASDIWSRWPWPQMFYGSIPSGLATYGTIVAEGLFPILVWFRKTRLVSLAVIASLHIGVAILLQNVTFFSLAMVCSFVMFIPGEQSREWWSKLLEGNRPAEIDPV